MARRLLMRNITSSSPMLVRITKRPPLSYGPVSDSLVAGRSYDLPPALASALLIDGCAELATAADETRYDTGTGFMAPQRAHDRKRPVQPPVNEAPRRRNRSRR